MVLPIPGDGDAVAEDIIVGRGILDVRRDPRAEVDVAHEHSARRLGEIGQRSFGQGPGGELVFHIPARQCLRRRIDREDGGVGRSQRPGHRLEKNAIEPARTNDAVPEAHGKKDDILLAGDGPQRLGPFRDIREQIALGGTGMAAMPGKNLGIKELHARELPAGEVAGRPGKLAQLLELGPDLVMVFRQILVERQTA